MMVAEDGKAIEQEIKSPEQAILWLWQAHNRANRRLSGDLTDDRAFPKEIFPNRQHCTHCYEDQALGSNLWSDFCSLELKSVCLIRLLFKVEMNFYGVDWKK